MAFGPDALALSNDGFGPGPDGEYYSNATDSRHDHGAGGYSASLTATNGNSFIGSVSFFYSAVQAFTVDVLDAGNSVLATLNLAANNGSCGASPYCFWSEASLDFSGAAKSIRFGGGYDALNSTTIAGFDNITVNAVPVPAAGWLLASGSCDIRRPDASQAHCLRRDGNEVHRDSPPPAGCRRFWPCSPHPSLPPGCG